MALTLTAIAAEKINFGTRFSKLYGSGRIFIEEKIQVVAIATLLALTELRLTAVVAKEINFATRLDNSHLTQRIVNIAASILVFCFIKGSLSAIARFSKRPYPLWNKFLPCRLPLSLLYQEFVSSSPIDDLHRAIQTRNVRELTYLIKRGVDVNAVDKRGRSPLFKAIEMGHLEIAQLLIQKGANESSLSQTLDEAAKNGNTRLVESILEWKVRQARIKWNWIDASWSSSTQQLHRTIESGNVEEVERFIREGADVNAVNGEGLSPLSKAAQRGHLEIAKALIQNGANINALHLSKKQKDLLIDLSVNHMTIHSFRQNDFNLTYRKKDYSPFPLAQAARAEYLEIVELLMQNEPNETSLNQALDEAVKTGNIALVNSILKWRTDKGETDWKRIDLHWCPLEAAVRAEQLDVVQHLIDQGAVINTIESCRIPRQPLLHTAIQLKNYDLVKCLIKNGANVNQQCHWLCHYEKSGSTIPLEEAARKKRLDIVALLIENGAECANPIGNHFKKNQKQNATLLMNQWELLYLLGIFEEKAIQILSQQPKRSESEKEISVVIDGKTAEYPLSFLSQIPYFDPFINGPWSQSVKESNRLHLEKPPCFEDRRGSRLICNHDTLRSLQKTLSNSNALWEENLEAFSPLGVGILPLLDYPWQLIALKNILKIQAQLLENRGVQFGEFNGISSPETVLNADEARASLDVEDFLCIDSDGKDRPNPIEKIDQTAKAINRCIQETSGYKRVILCNTLIYDLIHFLDDQPPRALLWGKTPKGPGLSPEKKPSTDIIEALSTVLKECPKLDEFLTILELPYRTTFRSTALTDLLRRLPNLLYLRIDVGQKEGIKMENFQLEKKAQNEESPKLRILKINGQPFTPIEKETLKRFFPNVDLLDI